MIRLINLPAKGFAFCGYSGSGKTTLISTLTARLSPRMRIAYMKHDAHAFEMDYPGKDTHRVFGSGARTVLISSPAQWAMVSSHVENFENHFRELASHDLVLVEGYKDTPLPKAVLLDAENRIVLDGTMGRLMHVECIIGLRFEQENLVPRLPFFQRDQIDAIEAFILDALGFTRTK